MNRNDLKSITPALLTEASFSNRGPKDNSRSPGDRENKVHPLYNRFSPSWYPLNQSSGPRLGKGASFSIRQFNILRAPIGFLRRRACFRRRKQAYKKIKKMNYMIVFSPPKTLLSAEKNRRIKKIKKMNYMISDRNPPKKGSGPAGRFFRKMNVPQKSDYRAPTCFSPSRSLGSPENGMQFTLSPENGMPFSGDLGDKSKWLRKNILPIPILFYAVPRKFMNFRGTRRLPSKSLAIFDGRRGSFFSDSWPFFPVGKKGRIFYYSDISPDSEGVRGKPVLFPGKEKSWICSFALRAIRQIRDRSENRMRFSERSSIFLFQEKGPGIVKSIGVGKNIRKKDPRLPSKIASDFDGRRRKERSKRGARSKIGLPSSIFLFQKSEGRAKNLSDRRPQKKRIFSGADLRSAPLKLLFDFRELRIFDAKDRMRNLESKLFNSIFKEFFNLDPLSQDLDETNGLSEIIHKRRISALGTGGVTSKNAPLSIRSIHPSFYGRLCPIDSPEGDRVGLINSLTNYARITSIGYIATPFYKTRLPHFTKELTPGMTRIKSGDQSS